MPGFDRELWQGYGYIEATTPLPPAATRRRDWDQCQHQSGYFLPWHRGYLAAFEAIVRDSIVKQGGPATWALPYWDYNEAANPNARWRSRRRACRTARTTRWRPRSATAMPATARSISIPARSASAR